MLAFPSNEFGAQEPGDSAEIQAFLDARGITFPVFEKVEVNGPQMHPVYSFLKSGSNSWYNSVKWNFAKVCFALGSNAERLPVTA